MPKSTTIVVVDNVDPDNLACALAACDPALNLNLSAVIVSGRPAHTDPTASVDESIPAESARVRRLNALRMRGFLLRAGCDIPVYEGLIAPKTVVPHRLHLREETLDLHHDGDADPASLAGGFDDALSYLERETGALNVIVGGPLSEVNAMLQRPAIVARLGSLTAQLGMFGFGGVELFAGGRRQFNASCDPTATAQVLDRFPGPLFMVPTDVTKQAATAFVDPNALSRMGINSELVEIYRAAFPHMMAPRGESIYIHDLHPALLLAELGKAKTRSPLYSWSSVRVTDVPHSEKDKARWGEIDIKFGESSPIPRFVVTSCNADAYRALLRRVLSPAIGPPTRGAELGS